MLKKAQRRNLFSRPPDWKEEDLGIATGGAIVAACFLLLINFGIIDFGRDFIFGNRKGLFISMCGGDDSCLIPLFSIFIILIFGIGQLLLWSIPGFSFSFSSRPILRGIGWGILLSSILTFAGYYIWIVILMVHHA